MKKLIPRSILLELRRLFGDAQYSCKRFHSEKSVGAPHLLSDASMLRTFLSYATCSSISLVSRDINTACRVVVAVSARLLSELNEDEVLIKDSFTIMESFLKQPFLPVVLSTGITMPLCPFLFNLYASSRFMHENEDDNIAFVVSNGALKLGVTCAQNLSEPWDKILVPTPVPGAAIQ